MENTLSNSSNSKGVEGILYKDVVTFDGVNYDLHDGVIEPPKEALRPAGVSDEDFDAAVLTFNGSRWMLMFPSDNPTH